MVKQTFTRISGALAVIGGLIGILNAPLLALSYFATPDGAESLEPAWVAAWAAIARPVLAPLLTFDSPDVVYAIYGGMMSLVFVGFLAGLLGLHSLQAPRAGRLENVGFWLSVIGAALLLLGVIGAYWIGALDLSFFAFLIPGLLATMLGTFIFGIGTLRARGAPRVAAWLLILGSLPGIIVLAGLVGHNSGGLLLIDIAWIIIGLRLWSLSTAEETTAGAY
jgi:uncharacterized membrane protein YedE/YeeE